jgi:hypothetical protein
VGHCLEKGKRLANFFFFNYFGLGFGLRIIGSTGFGFGLAIINGNSTLGVEKCSTYFFKESILVCYCLSTDFNLW